MFKIFKKLTTDQKIAIASFAALSAVSAVVAMTVPAEQKNYAAIAAAAAVFLLFERISRVHFENKVMERFNDIVSENRDLRYLGGVRAGIDWFIKNSRALDLVRNTVFTRTDSRSFTVSYADLERAIIDALDGNCEWRDIVGKTEQEEVEKFRAKLSDAQKSWYSAKVIESDLPLQQIMLLKFSGSGRTAVLFGWSHRGGKESGSRVFLSESVDTYRFFEDYLDSLEMKATELFPQTPPNLRKKSASSIGAKIRSLITP